MPCDSESAVATKVAAGAPESLSEDGFGLSAMAGEIKFPSDGDIIREPCINLTQKVIEIMRGYKTGPNYFIPVEVSSLDD